MPISYPKLLPVILFLCVTAAMTPSCRPPAPSYQGFGYLIVAPEALLPVVQDFEDYKASQGFLADRVSLEEVLANSPGADDPEKIRNYLMAYSMLTPAREFVLLVGSMDTMPMRVAYPDPYDHSPASAVPTDFYYEELTSNWDADGDGFLGEYGDDMSKETEDYRPELYVGRIPWDDDSQVRAILETILVYEQELSPRMRRALAAGVTIAETCDTAMVLNLAESFLFAPSGYETITLYEDCPSANPDFPLSRENFLGQWEAQEPGFVLMFSHGSPYGAGSHETSTYFIDVDHIPREVAPAVAVTSGCSVASPDSVDPSLGRVLIRDGVCASFLGASRITWYGTDPFPVLLGAFESATTLITERRALAEAKTRFIELYAEIERVPENLLGPRFHQNLFQQMLYGDPSIQVR